MCARRPCEFKIMLLGENSVGKSSLAIRYDRNQFAPNCLDTTIGADYFTKVVNSHGKDYKLGIWDTAGNERYDATTRLYCRGAHAAVMCYTPTCLRSWDKVRYWVAELRTVEKNCKIYLCGTKMDLLCETPRQVSEEIVSTYAQGLHGHMLVSSKTGQNVDELFQKITDDCVSDTNLMNEVNRARETALRVGTKQQYSGCQVT